MKLNTCMNNIILSCYLCLILYAILLLNIYDIHVYHIMYIDALVQDCSISSALAMEILQCCAKPSI